MKLFVAEPLDQEPELDILRGSTVLFQSPVDSIRLNKVSRVTLSDAVLVPHDAKSFTRDREYMSYLDSLSRKKPLIFFDRGDFPAKPNLQNSFSMRVAIQPGEKAKNCLIVPYNVENLARVVLREYQSRPNLTFMGQIPRNTYGRFLRTAITAPFHPIQGNGALTRMIYHRAIQKTSLDYNYVLRSQYGARRLEDNLHFKHRVEYLEMLAKSDFVLCPRGDTNSSMRFYECLSAGRFPLLPRSGIAFPSLLGTDYLNSVVSTSFRPGRIELQVTFFWKSIEPAGYKLLQMRNKKLFERQLNYNVFMNKLFSMKVSELFEFSKKPLAILR